MITHFYVQFPYTLIECSFFEKLMTYSGLVSGYMWSKKAKKKDKLSFFFKQKILIKFFRWGRPVIFSLFMFFSKNFCVHIYTYMYIKISQF
jgi:hypothetical protein